MARKKRQKKQAKHKNRADDSDNESTHTSDAEGEEVMDVGALLDDSLEKVGEKRRATRVAGLEKLADLLRKNYEPEFVVKNQETLSTTVASSVRKGTPSEVAAACSLLCVCCVSVPDVGERFVEDASDVLQVTLRNPKKNATARVACAHAFGVLHFISSDETAAREFLMQFARKMCNESDLDAMSADDSSILAEVVNMWSLLASCMTAAECGLHYNEHVPFFMYLLDSLSLDVRKAAGEAIALVYSAYAEADMHVREESEEEAVEEDEAADEDDEEEAEEEDDDDVFLGSDEDSDYDSDKEASERQRRARSASISASLNGNAEREYPTSVDHEELVALVQQLSRDGNRRRAKKERKEQRSVFRDILRTVEDHDLPMPTITVGSDKHELNGWVPYRRLEELRRVLAVGFLMHFSFNPLFAAMFNVDINVASGDVGFASRRALKDDLIYEAQLKARERFESDRKARKQKKAHHFAAHFDDDL